jgi:predicted transcriptional regulator
MMALFAIKPRYAHAILDGRKTIELRRGRINASISSMVVYATKPERVVLGAVDVLRVEHLNAQDFVSRRNPIEAELRYVSGAEWMSVLHLARPRRLVRPMSLQDLYPGVRAPQMWQRIETDLPPELL